MTDMPDWLFIGDGGYAFASGAMGELSDPMPEVAYIRAGLVAAKDAAIAALAEASLRDMREIARLRELLQDRDGYNHAVGCSNSADVSDLPCICGHDAVVAYFREIEG